ncbi:His-Xaa-Ser system protein HxsD [Nitratidesulfovibrio sp. D1]|uniref:His-Xaa-Ser system protein HxsD n=1 Tax=Nitratidesulfovibrio sp. D1 TaxID=3440151 RepID=UPI003EBAE6E3
MKGILFPEQDGGKVILSKEFFAREPVFVAAAKFTERYYVGIQPHGDDSFEVYLRSKDDDGDVSSAIKIFCNELIEQQVRHDLQNRFGKLREIIVAHAFSPLERQ